MLKSNVAEKLLTTVKRVVWVLFFIFLSSHTAMAGPRILSFTNNDADSIITLNQDTVAVIELWSNPSTGHGWRVKPPLSENIRIVGSEFVSSRPELLGAGGTEKIYVVGADPGRSELLLEYRRAHAQAVVDTVRYKFMTRETFTESFSLPSSDEPEPVADSQTDVAANLGLPTAFNWCDQNGCTPVRDQGSCGSCWAFATVGPLESLIKINDGETVNLSEQYLVSCNSDGWSCDGGYWAHDYHEWKAVSSQSEAGAVLENDFPYRASDVSCGPDHPKSHQIASWEWVCGSSSCKPSTDQLKQAIYEHGPLTVSVCVNSAMQNYRGGVFTGPGCSSLNHGVVLVGWNDDGGYWIMRNSWGSSWGESGYMRIGYGVSGIGSDAAYVVYNGTPNPDPEPDPEPTDGKIENGQTLTDLSAERGDWLRFYIDVPEGAADLRMEISGGSGDADLYTRFDVEPTTSAYDCRPYRNGNSETCTEASPQAGRWHIGLRAYRSFSGVSLTAGYDAEDSQPEPEPEPEPTGQCVTADNRDHIAQDRAYPCGFSNWQACAVGSGDYLGWAANFFSEASSVQETADDYWEKVESCP